MKQIDFPHSTLELRNGIVWITFKENAELDVKEIRELTVAVEKLMDKQPYVLMSDVRVYLTITPEARKVAADKKEAPFIVANAVIINNLAMRVTANFFASFNKPHFKFKVFTSEEKAIKWLLNYHPNKKPAYKLD